jgi:hypothetical protein
MRLTIAAVKAKLHSEGVALMKYNGCYEFWNIKDRAKNGASWIGHAYRLKEVLEEYKKYKDENLHLEIQSRHEIVNLLACILPQ